MKVLITLLIAMSALCSFSKGTSDSNPDVVYLCDTTSSRFGCDPKFWTNGNRLQCQNKTQIMAWASKPVRSSCYELVAGEESNPVTTYKPDAILTLHLRVKCYGKTFRGVLLYAVNEKEEKVGDWEISAAEPTEFKRPWVDPEDECYGSLMHSNAEIKPYHSVLYFKAPSPGTGNIKFRCLVKYGNANNGAFYWPEKDLTLNEGNVAPLGLETIFRLGEAGQSCSDLCESIENYSCDGDALIKMQDPSFFTEAISDQTVCIHPLLSGCGVQAATYDSAKQYCYYPESDCISQNRTLIYSTCDTKIPNVARFCACAQNMVSSSNILPTSLSLIIFALFALNPRMVVVMFALVSLATAHNWINSPSRSNSASTYVPFKPPTTDMPHAQVGPGQAFQIEWMTGHIDFTWFAIVHSKNQHLMSQITEKLLTEYITLAPASAFSNASSGIYQRFHRKGDLTLDNGATKNFFFRLVNSSDPLYIPRGSSFRNRYDVLAQFKLEDLKDDVRVSYRSDKYPWIEAVYKFWMCTDTPGQPDTTNFWIPGFAGYGRYLVQYLYNGYRDAVDVDYVAHQVQDIYGTPPNSTRWTRIDHCLFDNPQAIYEWSEIITNASYCMERCESRRSDVCWGVNVVPLVSPTAYKFNQPSGTTWIYPHLYGSDIYVPWNATVFNNTERDRILRGASPSRYMCYAVKPADFTDTTDEYTISRDPDDPVFYSTCYMRYKGNLFPGYSDSVAPSVAPGTWRYNDKCIDCHSKSYNEFSSVVPSWKVADTCINCDVEPKTAIPPPPFSVGTLVEKAVRCDGQDGVWLSQTHHNCSSNSTCVIPLCAPGRTCSGIHSMEDCYQLVVSNPNCSNHFYWGGLARRCFCYANFNCCKNCSRQGDGLNNVYEIKPTSPDPTCSTGALSKDRAFCCSASCGSGCGQNSGVIPEPGFCYTNFIVRSCNSHGPPCKM